MNEKDINEKISSWFEPKPIEFMDSPELCLGYDMTGKVRFKSPLGAWWHDESHYQEPQPLDYFHSEDANARLLDSLLDEGYCILKAGREFIVCWPKDIGPKIIKAQIAEHRDRKTAVVLAFCYRNGIATEEAT